MVGVHFFRVVKLDCFRLPPCRVFCLLCLLPAACCQWWWLVVVGCGRIFSHARLPKQKKKIGNTACRPVHIKAVSPPTFIPTFPPLSHSHSHAHTHTHLPLYHLPSFTNDTYFLSYNSSCRYTSAISYRAHSTVTDDDTPCVPLLVAFPIVAQKTFPTRLLFQSAFDKPPLSI